jgi:teichoic acid transport system ATP-binding protein
MAEPEHVGPPAVIVDDVHVTYTVWGAERARADRGWKARLQRLRGSSDVAAVRREVHAVQGVSFVAHRGEAIALVGRNGSGKSTLLRAIAGLHPVTSGAVYVQGQASLLGVNAALMRNLTGERNIELGCLAMGMSPDDVERAKPDIIEFSGIGDFVHLPMATYSSGMAARLRFAIATAVTHDILMIDEALATGDADFRERSRDRIRELREEAAAVFLVSHSLGTVRETCTRALWIDNGRLRMDGTADAVVDAYEASVKRTRKAARAAKAAQPSILT